MTVRAALSVIFVTALAGCAAAPGDDSIEGEAIEGRDDDLFAASGSIWPTKTIPVCWVNPSDELADRMAWTRAAVEGSWQAHSQLVFTGWGACGGPGSGIRILIADQNPVSNVGTYGQGSAHTMILNLTFDTWSANPCQTDPAWCVRTIAVHEFGHAIGFDHEQNRPDSPEWCASDATGYGGDLVLGAWDEASVMNYCNPNWVGNGNLSAGDIAGVQAVYGAPGGAAAPPPPQSQPQPQPPSQDPAPPPADPTPPQADPCNGLTYEGTCQDGFVHYCDGGPKSIDCPSIGMTCGWDAAQGFYNCI